jgi:hypothetical protein
MMQPGMHGTGVNQVCHGHLVNTAQALKIGVSNHLVDQFIVNGNKTINRVVNYFSERH